MRISISDYTGDRFEFETAALARRINDAAFVAFYDAAVVASDSIMRPSDWCVSTLLQAPIRRYAPFEDLAEASRQQWNACNAALHALGGDIPLQDGLSVDRRAKVQQCFSAFMAPTGIGPSIAAKTLHKKRPALIPVVDEYVARVLAGPHKYQLTSKQITDIIYDHFRPQLLQNLSALGEVSGRLKEVSLSPARIFDIAIWMHADDNRVHYRLRS